MLKRVLAWLMSLLFLLPVQCAGPSVQQSAEPVPEQSTGLSVTFLDVGQADAIFVECDGHALLIDGGNKSDSQLLYSFLKSSNTKVLDAVISTHPHEDHIGGLPSAFNAYRVLRVYSPVSEYDNYYFERLKNKLNGTELKVPGIGESFELGSARVQFLNTGKEYKDFNAGSLAVRITYGSTAFLFMADTKLDTERDILDAGYDVTADVIKIGHHGGNGSTGYRLLRAARPSMAVISVGKNNDYGHPSEEVLSRLADAGVTVYRTDRNGTIRMESDGEKITADVEKQDKKEPTKEEVLDSENDTVEEYPYVGNKSSGKFHRTDCTYAVKMNGYNRIGFKTAEEARKEGYQACKCCKP